MSDATIPMSLDYTDCDGQTCDVCRRYLRMDKFPPNDPADDWFRWFPQCLECIESASVWRLELTGLGENDSAWRIWEREVADGPAVVEKLLAKTRDCEVYERHDAPWRIDVRFGGWAPGRKRRKYEDGGMDCYELTATHVPTRMEQAA